MSLHTLPVGRVSDEATREEKLAYLKRVVYGRYHTVCEVTSKDLLAVSTPEDLIRILVLLRRRLRVRLTFIPTPPPNEALRSRRQTCEGRIGKINEEIELVCRTFDLILEKEK